MTKPKLSFEEAQAAHQAGQLAEAKALYLTLLQHNPHASNILHSLSILCAQQDNFPEAIGYLQQAVQYEPHNPVLHLHLANMLKIQGLFSQSADVLKQLLEMDKNYVPAYNNLGSVSYAQGKFADAVHYYQLAIEKQPDYVDAIYNLGLAYIKQQKFLEAIQAFEKLLQLAPEHFAAHFQIACVRMQQENFDEAIKQFILIDQSNPYHLETQTNLATCFLKKGLLNEAKQYYLRGLDLAPNDIQILFNLGVINMQQGHIDPAIQFYQKAIRINADFFAAHNNLGVAFLAKQHVAFALHHFQEALRLQPHNAAIQYTVKMLSQNQHLLTAPPEYVKSLFDAYADHYEPHLLSALDYQVPTLLFNAVTKTRKLSDSSLRILDLGCGTGLCGVPFKPYAAHLVGVDLSEKMLEVAAEKNLYDELTAQDLTTFLANQDKTFELILAGDVLVYIGKLDDMFSHAAKALADHGLFAFNAEINETTDYKMNQSGRFSHHKKYLDQLANEHRFEIAYYDVITSRMQNNEPVYGHLYVLRKKSMH